jgi:hypothetical protein
MLSVDIPLAKLSNLLEKRRALSKEEKKRANELIEHIWTVARLAIKQAEQLHTIRKLLVEMPDIPKDIALWPVSPPLPQPEFSDPVPKEMLKKLQKRVDTLSKGVTEITGKRKLGGFRIIKTEDIRKAKELDLKKAISIRGVK